MKLSLCMIVKDEEQVIERCLSSVAEAVDEIIVVDTGSTDATRDICARFTKNIFNFTWIDDFAAARNFSFSKASGDYIIWLDADDIVTPDNLEKLKLLKTQLAQSLPDMVMCRYDVSFAEDGASTFSYYRERIVRRAVGFRWVGFVHECIVPWGNVIRSNFAVNHGKLKAGDSTRNLEIYRRKLNEGAILDCRHKFYYGRELFYNKLYADCISVLEQLLTDPKVWYINAVDACGVLADSYIALGDIKRAENSVLRSFTYCAPKPELLCKLATLYKTDDLRRAAFWYEAALHCPVTDGDGGFYEPDYQVFVPCVELSRCYYLLGEFKKAQDYHRRAAAVHPLHPSVLYNKQFFN